MTIQIAEGILAKVAEITGYDAETIRSGGRVRDISRARAAIMFALSKRTSWSQPAIARFVGLTDHTSARHAIQNVPLWIEREGDLSRLVRALLNAPGTDVLTPESVRIVNIKAARAIAARPETIKYQRPVAPTLREAAALSSRALALAVIDALAARRAA